MSDDKRKRAGAPSKDRAQPDQGRTSGLLGDLESIRTLLEESEDAARSGLGTGEPEETEEPQGPDESGAQEPGALEALDNPDADDDVPLLEDVVHGGVSVNESFLSGEGDFQDSGEASGLNDELFKALLSDEWRDTARKILDETRATIERHPTEWTPEHTDALNEALKVRIDETLQSWLREVVHSRVNELRHVLLDAVRDELARTVEQQFDSTSDEDPDGQ